MLYGLTVRTLFQFHYGSIKIIPSNVVISAVPLFQFHYGSIKILMLLLQK